MISCRVCGNAEGNRSHTAREMMFGFRESFEYLECKECGCLQLLDVPADLSRYYPAGYYSFQPPPALDGSWRTYLKQERSRYCLEGKSAVGMIFTKVAGVPDYYEWFKTAGVKSDSAILDVGCGAGGLLLLLREEGFSDLTGMDPFLAADIHYPGVTVFKKELVELDRQFDFIMLNHSFEHTGQPRQVLREVHRLLKPNHFALIRTPVASSYAWRHYGVNWFQLDAPRHLFVQTVKSMRLLAEPTGWHLAEVVFDSNEQQFWASEQYQRDIPFRDPRSYYENPAQSLFSPEQIEAFRMRAVELNQQQDGDQACFYLHKA
jgi:2-polyprenyl-3-methyl-5-hydroxy-6-metoxy-1,4-benzoquinol methylase